MASYTKVAKLLS